MGRKTKPSEPAGAYAQLRRQLRHRPFLAQGSAFQFDPPASAPRAQRRYMWTRKVKNKTVTCALSQEQYELMRAAISANRHLEETLQRIRELSQNAILNLQPETPRKQTGKPS